MPCDKHASTLKLRYRIELEALLADVTMRLLSSMLVFPRSGLRTDQLRTERLTRSFSTCEERTLQSYIRISVMQLPPR